MRFCYKAGCMRKIAKKQRLSVKVNGVLMRSCKRCFKEAHAKHAGYGPVVPTRARASRLAETQAARAEAKAEEGRIAEMKTQERHRAAVPGSLYVSKPETSPEKSFLARASSLEEVGLWASLKLAGASEVINMDDLVATTINQDLLADMLVNRTDDQEKRGETVRSLMTDSFFADMPMTDAPTARMDPDNVLGLPSLDALFNDYTLLETSWSGGTSNASDSSIFRDVRSLG